jgi:hypothetical protein
VRNRGPARRPGRTWFVLLLALLLAGPAGAALGAPAEVKAAYLSYFGVGDREIRERVLALVGRTELNAIVIDVKGDHGFVPHPSRVAAAVDAGALGPVRIRNFGELIGGLRQRGVYTIARLVVFKDDVLARHRPEWAVLDARTGAPWRDGERLAWIDPFRREAWSYTIALAREAADLGFDEIQFDYLRFPADGALAAARYSQPNVEAARIRAITGFLAEARRALEGTRAALAVDVFGYIAFNPDDTGLGQRVEDLAPLVDYLSPMAYPSAYHRGIPGFPNPVAHPYEVVHETVRRIRQRAAGTSAGVRPWIQDFRDYAFDRRAFGPREVRAQMRAAADAGATGWMLWNPHNAYTAEALGPARSSPPATERAPRSSGRRQVTPVRSAPQALDRPAPATALAACSPSARRANSRSSRASVSTMPV